MTLPDQPPARKRLRLGLYAPFAGLILLVAVWAFVWAGMREAVFRGMDGAAQTAAESGYRVDWTGRRVTGFPFWLDLEVTAPRVREASGWALSAVRIKAQAPVYAPGHWVIVAPDGVTLTRRVGGDVAIGARVLRASILDLDAHPPRLSIEGEDLTFTAAPGAATFGLTSAKQLNVQAKAGPQDQGAAYAEIAAARTTGPGFLHDVAGEAPVTLVGDVIFNHARAMSGRGFAGALDGWRAAGGALQVRRLSLEAGAASIEATSGILSLGGDGRLRGALPLRLKGAPRLLTALGQAARLPPRGLDVAKAVLAAHDASGVTQVGVDFEAGQTTLGPAAIGPAPRVY
jgi:hypothetical protein